MVGGSKNYASLHGCLGEMMLLLLLLSLLWVILSHNLHFLSVLLLHGGKLIFCHFYHATVRAMVHVPVNERIRLLVNA